MREHHLETGYQPTETTDDAAPEISVERREFNRQLDDFGKLDDKPRHDLLWDLPRHFPDLKIVTYLLYGYDWVVVDAPGSHEVHKTGSPVEQLQHACTDIFIDELPETERPQALAIARAAANQLSDDLRSSFKIHLQPQHHDVGQVARRLIEKLTDTDDARLRSVVPEIKLYDRDTTATGDPRHMPEIVAYVRPALQDERPDPVASRQNCETALRLIIEAVRDLEPLAQPAENSPRHNQSLTELVHVAQSGGDLKDFLRRRGLLDEIFDANQNHAVIVGERPFDLNEIMSRPIPEKASPKVAEPPPEEFGPRHVRI